MIAGRIGADMHMAGLGETELLELVGVRRDQTLRQVRPDRRGQERAQLSPNYIMSPDGWLVYP